VFTPRFTGNLALATVSLTVMALTAGVLASATATERTSVFLCLGLGQLGVAWSIRSRSSGTKGPRAGLGVAIAGAVLLLAAGVVVGPLQDLLRTRTPGPLDVAVAVALALVPGLLVGARVRQERRAALERATGTA
jgi:hypothetical protein